MPTSTSKKTSKKILQKSIFPSKLASQNSPKSTKNRKKLQKIGFEKNFVKKGHGAETTPPHTKLFGTLPDYPIIFPMISTSLSIDLPLVALIIKASSSTWNASHMSI